MTDTLERIIYGQSTTADTPALQLLALSDSLSPEDVALWPTLVALEPQAHASKRASQTLGIFTGPGRSFLLVTAYNTDSDRTIYEYVQVPRKLLLQAAGKLEPLARRPGGLERFLESRD